MGDHPGEVGHPNGVKSCQKSIGTIRYSLAISYNNWQHCLIFLDTQNETNARTKPYIEAMVVVMPSSDREVDIKDMTLILSVLPT